jgi:radical SAM protein with 4Fe4S-binding SPASM domain
VIEKLSSIGVDNIRLSFPWSLHEGGEVEKYGFLPREDYYNAVKVFQELKQEFSNVTIREPQLKPFDHCFMLTQSLAVSPEGDVYPCPEVCVPVYRSKFSYGSVLTNGIFEIWGSQKHKKLFHDLNPRNENCICCPVDWKFNEICSKFWPPELGR